MSQTGRCVLREAIKVKPMAMKSAPSARLTSSGWFIALLLVAFSASGLLAGMLTRQIGGVAVGSSPPAASPTSTQGAVDASAAGVFTLKVQFAPNPARAGQTLQITVTAYTPSSVAVARVQCTPLQQAGAPGFDVWPDPQPTDANGQARWSVTLASQTAPGSYPLNVQGDGALYKGHWFGTLVVTA